MARKLVRIPKRSDQKQKFKAKNKMTDSVVLTAEELTHAKNVLKIMSPTQAKIIRNMQIGKAISTVKISHNPNTKFTLKGYGLVKFVDENEIMLTPLGVHIMMKLRAKFIATLLKDEPFLNRVE